MRFRSDLPHRSRREFMRSVASAWIALHFPIAADKRIAREPRAKPDSQRPVAFDRIVLETAELEQQEDFYRNVLELPVTEESRNRFSVQAGPSRIAFVRSTAQTQPFYHFAFNIPENMLEPAIEWLMPRTELIPVLDTHQPIAHFKLWNAHAVYFYDPAGNIVEFIARHDLPNAAQGSFSPERLLNVSEIGLVTEDVPEMVSGLQQAFDVGVYKRPTSAFTAVGDEHGLFVVVNEARRWFPDRRKAAAVFPTAIEMSGDGKRTLKFDRYPYRVDAVGRSV